MLEFFRRLFSPEPRSSDTAKERLRLVLLSDHLSLAPDVVEALKADLLAVISRYLEIDPAQADVTFEQREREVAMLASIPIVGVRERATVAPEPAPATAAKLQPEDEAVVEPGEIPAPIPAEPEAQPAPAAHLGALKATGSSARRRRRKKAALATRPPLPQSQAEFGPA